MESLRFYVARTFYHPGDFAYYKESGTSMLLQRAFPGSLERLPIVRSFDVSDEARAALGEQFSRLNLPNLRQVEYCVVYEGDLGKTRSSIKIMGISWVAFWYTRVFRRLIDGFS